MADRGVVTEPSWIPTAEREEAADDNENPYEYGPNDVDSDGDGLCNEIGW